MISPKMSVAVPFYGPPALLEEALRSLAGQSYENMTVHVVDDCYPGNDCQEIVHSLSDPRFRYVRNDFNLGLNGNIAKCLELLDGDLVLVMGADDVVPRGFLEQAIHVLSQSHQASVLQPTVREIGLDGRPVSGLVPLAKRFLTPPPGLHGGQRVATRLMMGNWTYFPSLVWRREALRKCMWNPNYAATADLHMVVQLLMNGGSIMVSDYCTFFYRRHDASDSSSLASSGARFLEERRYFAAQALSLSEHGWNMAAWAARLHPTSRVHAAIRRSQLMSGWAFRSQSKGGSDRPVR